MREWVGVLPTAAPNHKGLVGVAPSAPTKNPASIQAGLFNSIYI
jgi:hypothetical protein